jgi:putrescine transport system substrate-binding protein
MRNPRTGNHLLHRILRAIVEFAKVGAAAVIAGFALSGCGERSSSPDTRASARPATADRVLYFSNWDGEIGPTTIVDFERDTGIDVTLDEIVDNVTLQTKLLSGASGSDVVVPGSNFLGPLIESGALQRLDRSRLPNWKHLDPDLLAALQAIDPGNQYGVPYVWGTQAYAYNVKAVRRALGREPEPSWALLFDPANTRRLASCGIAWQDSAGSIMTDLALLAIGRDPAAEHPTDLEAAEQALHRVRGDVRYLDTSGRFRTDLATGEVCVATGASGELLQARDLARETGNGIEIRYVIPDEGALMWVDLLVIPRDAPHVDAAHRFINYLLEPRVIAAVTNASKFANANRSADPHVDPATRADPGIYPDAETRARLRLVPAESLPYVQQRTRMWTRVRTRAPR